MNPLEQRILSDGTVQPGNILKVDSFLNYQIDTELYDWMAEEFARRFEGEKITKVLTIESSGIGIACFTAHRLHVPALFAKKNRTKNISSNVYMAAVSSYTTGVTYPVMVSRDYLSPADRVLIIDDFLARGAALLGLIDIVHQSGATLVGCGIAIEKSFQSGGDRLRDSGIRVESLAKIKSMTDSSVSFQ